MEKKAKTSLKPNLNRKVINANWENLQAAIKGSEDKLDLTKPVTTAKLQGNKMQTPPANKVTLKKLKQNEPSNKITTCLAMDCEMVGIGLNGLNHMLARVSIVNEFGEVLIDKYVKPTEEVTNYRTYVSGIRPKDIECGDEFQKVQKQVIELIKNRILIGHALKNDFQVLRINHPKFLIRDTSRYSYIKNNFCKSRTPSLKTLATLILSEDIQEGEHDSVEDARTALKIYKKFKQQWEREMKAKNKRYE